jgi:hypothetical protein
MQSSRAYWSGIMFGAGLILGAVIVIAVFIVGLSSPGAGGGQVLSTLLLLMGPHIHRIRGGSDAE